MGFSGQTRGLRARLRDGFSLLEVMIAAMLLIIVFFGLAQLYTRGRTQIDYEEDRRKATAVAQARLDGLRRDYTYDRLPAVNGTDTTFVVDNRSYRVHHYIYRGRPETNATTESLVVYWNARTYAGTITRSLSTTTIVARGMP
jgi:Tfp pilus assembly protein PilV